MKIRLTILFVLGPMFSNSVTSNRRHLHFKATNSKAFLLFILMSVLFWIYIESIEMQPLIFEWSPVQESGVNGWPWCLRPKPLKWHQSLGSSLCNDFNIPAGLVKIWRHDKGWINTPSPEIMWEIFLIALTTGWKSLMLLSDQNNQKGFLTKSIDKICIVTFNSCNWYN